MSMEIEHFLCVRFVSTLNFIDGVTFHFASQSKFAHEICYAIMLSVDIKIQIISFVLWQLVAQSHSNHFRNFCRFFMLICVFVFVFRLHVTVHTVHIAYFILWIIHVYARLSSLDEFYIIHCWYTLYKSRNKHQSIKLFIMIHH